MAYFFLSYLQFPVIQKKALSALGHGSIHVQSLQPCPTLCNPMDCSPSGSSVHGILQARILEWGAIPFSRDLPNLRRQILYHWATKKALSNAASDTDAFHQSSASCWRIPRMEPGRLQSVRSQESDTIERLITQTLCCEKGENHSQWWKQKNQLT